MFHDLLVQAKKNEEILNFFSDLNYKMLQLALFCIRLLVIVVVTKHWC